MPKTDDKQKRQDLGIFYTPPSVANFIFDILLIGKSKEEKETGRWESRKHYPSVIDPAVGEGVFLKSAIEKGFTKPKYVFGVDIDEAAKKQWEEINLLQSFGSKAELDIHFFHQNGLLPLDKKKVLRYKKGGLKQFDVVVGNPPYGGLGIYEDMKALLETITSSEKVSTVSTQTLNTLFGEEVEKQIRENRTVHKKIALSPLRIFELRELSKALINYEVWKDKSYLANRLDYPLSINGIPFNLKYVLVTKEIERLKSYPIEILFVERFLQLAKPGGWIAIIIPDGILTNSNAHYVREFIADKAKIEAIISLPRGTFKHAGTTAKTSILFLRKRKEGESPGRDYPVFLASAEEVGGESFQEIVKEYKKFYNITNKPMNKSSQVQIIKDASGKEAIMVRVDKTLKEMLDERPQSRWDAHYWHPGFEPVTNFLRTSKHNLLKFGDVIDVMTNGNRDREWASRSDEKVRFIQVVNVLNTGIDFEAGSPEKHYAKKSGIGDPLRSRLRTGDILLLSGATGSIGRATMVLSLREPTNISQDANLIRLKREGGIKSAYFVVFLLSKFGGEQIERHSKGVSGQIKITFDQIESMLIPQLPKNVQNHMESEYKKMSAFHDKAMEAKKQGDEAGYKKNIETAERMLRDLIVRTEAVIRGEREDVV